MEEKKLSLEEQAAQWIEKNISRTYPSYIQSSFSSKIRSTFYNILINVNQNTYVEAGRRIEELIESLANNLTQEIYNEKRSVFPEAANLTGKIIESNLPKEVIEKIVDKLAW